MQTEKLPALSGYGWADEKVALSSAPFLSFSTSFSLPGE